MGAIVSVGRSVSVARVGGLVATGEEQDERSRRKMKDERMFRVAGG
jgi:hypothetical protein